MSSLQIKSKKNTNNNKWLGIFFLLVKMCHRKCCFFFLFCYCQSAFDCFAMVWFLVWEPYGLTGLNWTQTYKKRSFKPLELLFSKGTLMPLMLQKLVNLRRKYYPGCLGNRNGAEEQVMWEAIIIIMIINRLCWRSNSNNLVGMMMIMIIVNGISKGIRNLNRINA